MNWNIIFELTLSRICWSLFRCVAEVYLRHTTNHLTSPSYPYVWRDDTAVTNAVGKRIALMLQVAVLLRDKDIRSAAFRCKDWIKICIFIEYCIPESAHLPGFHSVTLSIQDHQPSEHVIGISKFVICLYVDHNWTLTWTLWDRRLVWQLIGTLYARQHSDTG